MLFNSIFFRGLVSSLLILSLSLVAFADTVRLKDGSIIKGKIVGFGDGKFTVAMGEGSRRRELTFMAAEVESIQFDAPVNQPQTASNRNAVYKEPDTVTPEPVKPPFVIKDPVEPSRQPSGEKMRPIQWSVMVLADNTSNGWTNSGWVIKKGQRVRITGDGKVSLGNGKTSPPSGVASLSDEQKLLKNVATGALLAVVGDDNNDFIYVGSEREFTASRDGALFLGINEGNLDDNSGSYNVKIEILPDSEK